ncbi:MAG TPA: OmcA/MtrC family decaheme c-type cytochrome [Gemmatimonadaceae bacterium]|nr:OmcA/MtrC family decaheme c-type cytochrome [Gemmatimonadaceae bacterium]
MHASGWAAVPLSVIALLACDSARQVSEPSSPPPPPAYQVLITGASVDEAGAVTVRYTLTRGGQAVGGEPAAALRPTWALAGLTREPVSGIAAWQSFVLTGGQTLRSLPVAGPGTPEDAILRDVEQPGSETNGTVQELGGGQFSYTFAAKLPEGLDPATTLRAGVWLAGTPGTASTTSTFDFTRSGAAVQQTRDLVVDARCNTCHEVVQAHGNFRSGTRVCMTCHTFQNADPDTVDPAALAGATPDTDPNPMEMGRLIHRIHAGTELPTLRDAETGELVPGQRYSAIGFRSAELVFGRVVTRTDNEQPPLAVAEGVGFPQDLRRCQACHAGAPQAEARFTDVSRRTCAGCHTDVWYGEAAIPENDRVHRLHTGGPQPDDTRCAECHLATDERPTAPADVRAIHQAPHESPQWNALTAEIVAVENLRPGQAPTVVFTLTDRAGTPTPLDAPTPANDAQSPIPRALGRVAITLAGPTRPELLTGNAPITGVVPLTTAADAQGRFRYTFPTPLPETAAGTWAVALEARRGLPSTDPARWPFTGEAVNEWALNPVVYVDTAAGAFPGGSPAARRTVIDEARCNSCHGLVRAHGDLRNDPEYCVMCHTPDATDWVQRPKGPAGNVALGATYDDVEERSIHFKTMIHRIHTGARTGSAELGLSDPLVWFGFRGSVNFLGHVEYPRELAQCTVCHTGRTYRIESIPADAPATVANESATLLHSATPAHAAAEARRLPVTAACTSCHDTGAALAHAARNTIDGRENCTVCHGRDGYLSVDEVHGVRGE